MERAPPPLTSFQGFGLLLQLIFGGLLFLGLFSRVSAFILSGEMAVAYWTVHAPNGPYPLENKGELSVLYCFIFLLLFAAGPGTWSLDAVLFWKKKA